MPSVSGAAAGLAAESGLAWGAPLACRPIAALSRGKVTGDHDDLLYVIRKPDNRFARVF